MVVDYSIVFTVIVCSFLRGPTCCIFSLDVALFISCSLRLGINILLGNIHLHTSLPTLSMAVVKAKYSHPLAHGKVHFFYRRFQCMPAEPLVRQSCPDLRLGDRGTSRMSPIHLAPFLFCYGTPVRDISPLISEISPWQTTRKCVLPAVSSDDVVLLAQETLPGMPRNNRTPAAQTEFLTTLCNNFLPQIWICSYYGKHRI